jgi:hypothetical protein
MALTILYPITNINNRIGAITHSILLESDTKQRFTLFGLMRLWYIVNLDQSNSVLFSAKYHNLSYTYPIEWAKLTRRIPHTEVTILYRMVRLPADFYNHEVTGVDIDSTTLSLHFPTLTRPPSGVYNVLHPAYPRFCNAAL